MTTRRDTWERIVSTAHAGIYESNYLKANSPDGQRGLWIKHNLLRPVQGDGIGEFWVILFERGHAPRVVKREVALSEIALSDADIEITAGPISLRADRATGSIADIRWDLGLTPTQPPLMHLRWDWMYTAGFPKKKLITPAPNLRFDGDIVVGGERWNVEGWIGMRGHNWGREHAWSYAYGNCNLWADGSDRLVDGFSARIRLPGGGKSPWLSTVMARQPDHDLNRISDWFGGATVDADRWSLSTGGCRLEMTADPDTYVGLRYVHPSGEESYCYNTKFASVAWDTPSGRFTSEMGELEVLFATPLAGVRLHPSAEWQPDAGDYSSGGAKAADAGTDGDNEM
jgi:hypothetical protein